MMALLGATVRLAEGQAQSFNGVLTVRLSTTTPDGIRSENAEFLSRDGQVRVNIGGSKGMSVLTMPADRKVFLLMPSQRRFAEVPSSAVALLDPPSTPPTDVTVTRTGMTETIAGMLCHHVIVTRGPSSTDVCLARDLGRYVNPLDVLSDGQLPAWQAALAAEGFPLKVTAADGTVRFEVLKVERRVVPRNQFTVPLNYSRTELPRQR